MPLERKRAHRRRLNLVALGEGRAQLTGSVPCPSQRLADHGKRGNAGESEQQGNG
ncbi:MAG TPA: hypothetical protein VL100_10095 [Croceibacterium sp.]|nr:hypothetical protein [Croceibacterium sp.]